MMSESTNNSGHLAFDELDAKETAAASQANIPTQLAKKIWAVTPNDVSLGIVEPLEPSVPNFETSSGSGSGSGVGSGSKPPSSDNASIYITEVERALYGDSTGYPENGTPNYFKAAENYSLFGESFLDFPKDTASCMAGLGAMGGGYQQPQRHPHQQQQQQQHRPPGVDNNNNNNNRNSASNFNEIPFPQFYHQMHHQQPPQPQLNPNHQHNLHLPQKPMQQQGPPQQQYQQQQQQHRSGAPPSVGDLAGLAHSNPNDFAMLYQQLMARNLRSNQQHHQQHPPQSSQQTSSSAAAAAALLYKNLEFQQQVQLRQLQQLQQQQQQQQPRMPRGIFGGNGGQSGGGGGGNSTNGKEPPAGAHK
ncbi:serine/threonine-protein kinase Doa isoform X2 [Drosophila takahashii]|uniref:serine/threonine-protein kinase Doa isoform X2 n=1 Tax=Drosophila takahashii TaxID=29030 RepID=UPI0038994257